VTVWYEVSAKKAGAIYSRCTCPVGSSGCKHAVAVVAEYLERLGASEDTPVADKDDERWELLADETGDESEVEADDLDRDTGDDEDEQVYYVHLHRHPEASGRKTLKASNEKIRKHIEAKSHDELVELLWALTKRFPELREEFRDRIALGEGNVDRLVTEARKEIRRVASESGWQDTWRGDGHTPDYSRVKHRLERLLELGHPDAVVRLGKELMTLGNEQIGQSNDEGETGEAVGECMAVIFQPVAASTLAPTNRLLFAIDAHLRDDCGSSSIMMERFQALSLDVSRATAHTSGLLRTSGAIGSVKRKQNNSVIRCRCIYGKRPNACAVREAILTTHSTLTIWTKERLLWFQDSRVF